MKTKALIFTVILSLGMVFQGCEKENEISPQSKITKDVNQKKKTYKNSNFINYNDLINADNPFDIYSHNLNEIYNSVLDSLLSLPNSIGSASELYAIFQYFQIEYSGGEYPDVDTTNYIDSESTHLNSYLSVLTIDNLIDSTIVFEGRILNSNSLTSLQKNRILSISSQYKFHFLIASNLIENYNMLKYDKSTVFRVCLGTKASETFVNDGNPIPEMAFILTAAQTFGWWMADCGWKALSHARS